MSQTHHPKHFTTKGYRYTGEDGLVYLVLQSCSSAVSVEVWTTQKASSNRCMMFTEAQNEHRGDCVHLLQQCT